MDPSSAEEFASKVYDYVVVGGRNAGLPLAVRLTENPEVSVAVLEAGRIIEDDPILEVPRFVGRASGNPKHDYAFKTVPQEHAANRVVPAPRGKMLGGSTGINYMVWDRAIVRTRLSTMPGPRCKTRPMRGRSTRFCHISQRQKMRGRFMMSQIHTLPYQMRRT